MARTKKAQVGITVKATRLTQTELNKLKRALRAVVSVLDAHDVHTVALPGGYRINYKRARR
jgi:hypothetical protein